MKDSEARSTASGAAIAASAVNTRVHTLNHRIDGLESQIRTQETTILNLTARLRALESKVFPTCKTCGQRLPGPLDAIQQTVNQYAMTPKETHAR